MIDTSSTVQRSPQQSRRRIRRKTWLVATMAVVGAALLTVSAVVYRNPDLGPARRLLAQGRLTEAEAHIRRALKRRPDSPDALLILGESIQRQGRVEEAIEIYSRIPDTAPRQFTKARLVTASILMHFGRLADAEQNIEAAKPEFADASVIDGLKVTLLTLCGRRWESLPYVQRTLTTVGDLRTKLIYLANPDEMPAPPEDIFARMFQVRDPLGTLGCARVAASLGRRDQAVQLTRDCLSRRPDLLEAHVLLGTILLDSAEMSQFAEWRQNLPQNADLHPGIWFIHGRVAQETGDYPGAIRCYWEVLRRQPNHVRATYQLSQLLGSAGHADDASVFLERSKLLTRLIEASVRIYDNSGSLSEIAICARMTKELGRWREAREWCDYLLNIDPNHVAGRELLMEIEAGWSDDIPWLFPDQDLAARFDYSTFPLPRAASGSPDSRRPVEHRQSAASPVAFTDDARRLGLNFVYFNGDDPSTEGRRMFEYTGGGVAVLDFDLDGWSDLYFTQGTDWPPDRTNRRHLDKLFRNDRGRGFVDITSIAGIDDRGFGQGATVGDYDNDGFPDVYVANIDGNRLFRNNGDGTFLDLTPECGLGRHRHWTTSCLLADINGDSIPDVYDVTFLDDSDIFTRICRGSDGAARSCAPAGFHAAPEHVYLGLGDGKFKDVTAQLGFDVPEGDGLGIVAADFDNSGEISLFVGNDGRANFYFTPPPSTDTSFRWQECGATSGLAFNDSGAPQASMGIAAGDANNDGLVDLFVTNFYNEADSLYLNLGQGVFTDRSRSAGLREPNWSFLGFGAQFLDADLDGWEDLIVTNGHVDDFTHRQIPFKMRPQFYRNRETRFTELLASDLGPFFDQPRLGRGLAKLDWNRDGLTDVAISHIGDPAALLTNRTARSGRHLGLRLVGTTRARDAIGTRVSLRVGNLHLERQLTAGDGYQASNERRLEFGLGDNADDVELQIRWPGGAVDKFTAVRSGEEYLAVEGRPALVPIRIE